MAGPPARRRSITRWGCIQPSAKGLYNQLVWAVNQLSIGYYAYREGRLTEIRFSDGVTTRLAPDLNAGTAALQYYFAQLYDSQRWLDALDVRFGFPALHASMFGDPWERAQHRRAALPGRDYPAAADFALRAQLDLELHRRPARRLGARWRLRRPGFCPGRN